MESQYTILKRRDIPKVLNQRGLSGEGAEIGVQDGLFSEHLLEVWAGELLYSIDPWQAEVLKLGDTNQGVDQVIQDRFCARTQARLSRFGDRSVIYRLTSIDASKLLPDRSLDFVYIDARHQYESVLEDLAHWRPKVRSGGLVSGHDWHSEGVRRAVQNQFNDLRISVTSQDGPWFSWFVWLP